MESNAEAYKALVSWIVSWQNKHPYHFSALISIFIISLILFYTPSVQIKEEEISSVETIVFVDFDELKVNAIKRVAKKEILPVVGEPEKSISDVERAYGDLDDANAVDFAFYPNIVPPRPVSALKKFYPRIVCEKGIEATVYVEILIAANGKVKSVTVVAVRLSKNLPPDEYAFIEKEFARDAVKILQNARFTPPLIQGKNVPVKFEMPLYFRLEN